MEKPLDPGPNFLLDWREPEESSRVIRAGIGTLLVHALLFVLASLLSGLDTAHRAEPIEVAAIKKYTPLFDPPTHLTQKEPNQTKAAKEVKLENLTAKPSVTPRTPTPPVVAKKQFQAPPSNPLPPGPKLGPSPQVLEPPKLEASAKPLPAQALPQQVVNVPPPQIQPEEKPKLQLETPGQGGSSPIKGANPIKIPVPKATIEEAVKSVARGGGGQGGVAVGDVDQFPSAPDALHRTQSPGRTQSRLELMSDPMGVDFKPYLIRILATVRRNWFAVIPESAHLGRKGVVSLQFAIDRSGQVPKLVIATPSGAEALDRAAVAGISASVPFPPLPAEFKGKQIVLQFSFLYN